MHLSTPTKIDFGLHLMPIDLAAGFLGVCPLLGRLYLTNKPASCLLLFFWVDADVAVGINPSSGKHLLSRCFSSSVLRVILGKRLTLSSYHFEFPPGGVGRTLGLVA